MDVRAGFEPRATAYKSSTISTRSRCLLKEICKLISFLYPVRDFMTPESPSPRDDGLLLHYHSLLLHYHSHVDNRYKRGLLTTMLDRAHRLSLSWSSLRSADDCEVSQAPCGLHCSYETFLNLRVADQSLLRSKSTTKNTTRVVIPFKDQESANIVKTQLKDLSVKLQCLRTAILPRSSRQGNQSLI